MKFAIAKEHRDFFQKQGIIEFEDFLSSDQLRVFNQAIDQALIERLSVPAEGLKRLSADNIFAQGRDLSRINDTLRKSVCQVRFAQIASELIEKKPLRLGYDQLFPARYEIKFGSGQTQKMYTQFIEQTTDLDTISCLQGVVCGLMLCLGTVDTSIAEEPALIEGPDVYPRQPGYAIYFNPKTAINLHNLYAHPGQRFYLIVYTQVSARYQLQTHDPHTHTLKHLGYVFNDKLNDRLHPIVYR